MKTLRLLVEGADKELVLADLYGRGTLGVVDEPGELLAFFDSGADLSPLLQEYSRLEPVEAEAPDVDWVQTVKDMWQPLEVGRTWYLVPEWSDEAAPPGRRRLTIHPGMASGTGMHPATQLALEMMESVVRPGDRVLDVGTGTGILADAARAMGAGVVVGCDIDVEAAVIARRNLPEAVGVFAGSVRSVISGTFDVVVANLNAVTLKAIGGELLRCRKEGGRCILSGIRKEEISLVGAIPGGKVSSTLTLGGWVSLEL